MSDFSQSGQKEFTPEEVAEITSNVKYLADKYRDINVETTGDQKLLAIQSEINNILNLTDSNYFISIKKETKPLLKLERQIREKIKTQETNKALEGYQFLADDINSFLKEYEDKEDWSEFDPTASAFLESIIGQIKELPENAKHALQKQIDKIDGISEEINELKAIEQSSTEQPEIKAEPVTAETTIPFAPVSPKTAKGIKAINKKIKGQQPENKPTEAPIATKPIEVPITEFKKVRYKGKAYNVLDTNDRGDVKIKALFTDPKKPGQSEEREIWVDKNFFSPILPKTPKNQNKPPKEGPTQTEISETSETEEQRIASRRELLTQKPSDFDFESMINDAEGFFPPNKILPAPENLPTVDNLIATEIEETNQVIEDKTPIDVNATVIEKQQQLEVKDEETEEIPPVDPVTTTESPLTNPTIENQESNFDVDNNNEQNIEDINNQETATVPPTENSAPQTTPPLSPETIAGINNIIERDRALDQEANEPPQIPTESATPPPLPPAETPETPTANTPVERNRVVRNIANQGILRDLIAKEAANNMIVLTEEEVNELAKRQADFVKVSKIEEFITKDKDRINKIFKTEGRPLSQADLKKELLKALFEDKNIANQQKISLLAEKIANESGLSKEEIEIIINNQEQRLRDLSLKEINAGRGFGEDPTKAQATAKSIRNKKIGFGVAKSIAYIGSGVLLSGLTGGVGAIGIMTGARMIDRLITDRVQKGKVDKKFKEMKDSLEADETGTDTFLKEFFGEIAVAQQKRITIDHKFEFDNFAVVNNDLIADYEGENRDQLIRAMEALTKIDHINNGREHDLLERTIDKIKKSDDLVSPFIGQAISGFNKFMIKGGENTKERMVSSAMLGGAYIAAREIPVIREVLLAMAGWKAGDFAGRMIWGDEKPEFGEIDDVRTPEEILNTLLVMDKNKTSNENKKLFLKLVSALALTFVPTIANQFLENTQIHGAKVAGAGILETKPSGPNPLDEAITEMKNVHGKNYHSLWELTDAKTHAMTSHFGGQEDVKILAESEGRMASIIDSIKDQVAKDPPAFGLPKGTNIDILSPADLEKLSQNDHFNEMFSGMFKNDSFADQAGELSAEAVKNIESNNAFYEAVASKTDGVRLDQTAYDAMDKMHNQGMTAEDTAEALKYANSHPTTAIPETSIENEALTRIEDIKIPSYIENFQDKTTMAEWIKVKDLMTGGHNEHAVGKSLDSILRRLGIAEEYSSADAPYFIIKETGYNQGTLNFEIPPPINYQLAEQMGNIHFSYDQSKNEMLGYIGDESVNLKDVKNVDKAIKTIFDILVSKINK